MAEQKPPYQYITGVPYDLQPSASDSKGSNIEGVSRRGVFLIALAVLLPWRLMDDMSSGKRAVLTILGAIVLVSSVRAFLSSLSKFRNGQDIQ